MFALICVILFFKPTIVEAHNSGCSIVSPSTMEYHQRDTPSYSSDGTWDEWVSWYEGKGYTYTGYSPADGSSWWLHLSKGGTAYYAYIMTNSSGRYWAPYNRWNYINGAYYYTNGYGIVLRNTWALIRINDDYYSPTDPYGYFAFDNSGAMCTGWHKANDENWYYFRIDHTYNKDGACIKVGESSGFCWSEDKNPPNSNSESRGIYHFTGINVKTNVYKKTPPGSYNYSSTSTVKYGVGDADKQVKPLTTRTVRADTDFVNGQCTDGYWFDSSVSGTVSGSFNLSIVNADYESYFIPEFQYYLNKTFSYKQQVYVRYQKTDGSWGDYSAVIDKNYGHGSTVSWSRAADSVYKAASISYKVTGANTKYVSVYRNSYNQTINYYYNKASGTYNSPTHTKTLLGSKSWSQLYETTFNAKSYKNKWGNVTGYHWSSMDSDSWTVKKAASTNSYYSANKYRLNVDLNKGSGSTTPSGTSGNIDMEYGTYINLGTPTMTGYTFSGWSITEHNSTGHSLSSSTFTMGYNKSYPNQSYTSTSTVKIKAKWDTNSYNLIYDLNDSIGSTSAQFGAYHPNTVKFDTEFTVSNPSRAGYSFAGWNITGMDNSTHYYGAHRTTAGYIDNTCETVFRNLNSSNKAVVTFRAVWVPNTYTMHFDGNGAAGGNVDDITVRYDENITLPANGYELDKNTFVGWTHDSTAHVGTYAEGQEILSSVIIDAAGMTTQNNGIIYLYCAWDPAPNITVSDKTFSLDEARNGLITEGRLFEGAYAMDEILDSEILPGTHSLENGSCNSFTITNFSEDEFTQFTDSGSATITYQVVDSVGNITEETITVFIVDNTPKEAQSGEGTYHVRFISDKYYDKTESEGGLPEDSIWRKRPEYVELLSEVMEK